MPIKTYLCDLIHDINLLVSDTISINVEHTGSCVKKKFVNPISACKIFLIPLSYHAFHALVLTNTIY